MAIFIPAQASEAPYHRMRVKAGDFIKQSVHVEPAAMYH